MLKKIVRQVGFIYKTKHDSWRRL